MPPRIQSTKLHKFSSELIRDLGFWAANPWRRYSLLIIIFLIGFLVGSSLGMVNGVLALMDPIGAFFTVLIIELMVKLRLFYKSSRKSLILLAIIDMFRIGIMYGLFTEALKLL